MKKTIEKYKEITLLQKIFFSAELLLFLSLLIVAILSIINTFSEVDICTRCLTIISSVFAGLFFGTFLADFIIHRKIKAKQ